MVDEKKILKVLEDQKKQLDRIEKLLNASITAIPKSVIIESSVRKKVKKTKGGPKFQLRNLVEENFFKQPKSIKNILEELKTRSYHYKPTDLTKPLRDLVREQILRRITLKNEQGKIVLHWANW